MCNILPTLLGSKVFIPNSVFWVITKPKIDFGFVFLNPKDLGFCVFFLGNVYKCLILGYEKIQKNLQCKHGWLVESVVFAKATMNDRKI